MLHGTKVEGGLKLGDGTVIATAEEAAGAAIVRPEKLSVRAGREKPQGNHVEGEILQAVYSGASVTYRIRTPALGETPLLAFMQNQRGEVLAPGSMVTASWDASHTIPVSK